MPARSDIAVGLVIAAIGAAIILASRGLHPIVGAHFGPALFPTILGVGMIIGGARLVKEAAMPGTRPKAAEGLPETAAEQSLDALRHKPRYAALVWVVVGTVLSAWLLSPVGFVPYCTILLGGMMLLLGVRFVPALALALPLSIGIYLAFVHLLLVPLPVGDLYSFG
jgi:putative tricarboxylic transport membrane protein